MSISIRAQMLDLVIAGPTFDLGMALYGTLSTISLPDLLQWIEASRKSGALVLESGSVDRTIMVREGRVVACSSNDPPIRLGQILLARGAINEEQLRVGLRVQEQSGGNLGTILVESGAVSSEDVVRYVAAKAEETIFGLFDWEEASFEFHDDAGTPPNILEVSLSIQDILLKGMHRKDELRRIREVFHDPGIVLAVADREIPEQIRKSRTSARILQMIDGQRTLAELLLHARGSEYLITKFLFELHRGGFLKIVEIRSTGPAAGEPARPVPVTVEAQAEGSISEAGGLRPERRDAPERGSAPHDLNTELDVARRLLARGEHEAAGAVLHAASRAFPGAPAVRQMIVQVEKSYLRSVESLFPGHMIPVGSRPTEYANAATLGPDEAYLLSLLDGKSDVQAILWVAPLRSLDVYRGLQKLQDRGLLTLRDPA